MFSVLCVLLHFLDQDQAPYLFPESSDEEILTKNK